MHTLLTGTFFFPFRPFEFSFFLSFIVKHWSIEAFLLIWVKTQHISSLQDLPVQPQQTGVCAWVLRRGRSSLCGAAVNLDQVWADQDPRRGSLSCKPSCGAQELQEQKGLRDPQEPTPPCVHRTCFWRTGSRLSASPAAVLYRSGWTWWTSGCVTSQGKGWGVGGLRPSLRRHCLEGIKGKALWDVEWNNHEIWQIILLKHERYHFWKQHLITHVITSERLVLSVFALLWHVSMFAWPI